MHRSTRRATAGLAVAATAVLLAAPMASAATVVSRADANAITVGIAGQPQGSGTVEATFDGTSETKTGNSSLALGVLGGQNFANFGALAQNATAGNGSSAACAGVAGSGGTVQVGTSDCLTPGTEASITLGSLDLSGLTISSDPNGPLAPLNAITTGLQPVKDALDGVIDQLEAQLGDAGLVLELGAIEGQCTASQGSATGDAIVTDARLVLRPPQQAGQPDIVLANLPVQTAPNTQVPTNTAELLRAINKGLNANFKTALQGALGPVAGVTDALLTQVANAVEASIQDQLKPLQDNLLRITINQQSKPTADSIDVTALRVEAVPAAAQFVDAALVDLQLGNVGCGPAGVVSPEEPPAPEPPTAGPRIPTAVSAGEAGSDGGVGVGGYAALAVGAAAAGAAGWGSLRRRNALRG